MITLASYTSRIHACKHQVSSFLAQASLALALFQVTDAALSHTNLQASMKPRNPSTSVKTSDVVMVPCGSNTIDKPTTDASKRTVLTAGQKFTVLWDESINHNAKYRIAFSADATDSFTTVLMDLNQFDNDALDPSTIAANDRQDKTANTNTYSYDITVPDVTCDNCSLQLLQKMYNGANSISPTIYVSCMDIKITGGTTIVPSKPNKPSGFQVKVQ